MIQGFKGVKYGLTVPASKKKAAPQAKPVSALAAFGDDSDGEHETVPQQLARQSASNKTNNKVSELPGSRERCPERMSAGAAHVLLGSCPGCHQDSDDPYLFQVAEVHAAALEQDASVFDYDGVFDSMQEAKVAPVRAA
jgi:hypothetical protein